MQKDKKELEKKVANLQTATTTTTVKAQPSSNRYAETNYSFTRYAFDTAGGGYQGL